MVKVDNQETLRLLTKRFMKMNRGRNVIAVCSIILTALLFTSLFSGTNSMILSKRTMDIKQFISSSHAMVQDLTKAEWEGAYDGVSENKKIAQFGEGIFLGGVSDQRFGFSTEVRYADKIMVESYNCPPTHGKMPDKKEEIAVSTLILDTLGVPRQLGQQVTLTFEVSPGKVKTDTFLLCGYWEGDKSIMAQFAWVSKSYAEENQYHVSREELDNGIYNGGMEYAVNYENLWQLEKKTEELNEASGFPKDIENFQVNPAFNMMEEDSVSYSSLALFVFMIALAGYLIIYNVFRISVKTDIRAYGLLKNVGTTGKQLKKIVRMQALRLSLVGIPLGLFLGYMVSLWMAPALTASIDASAAITVTSANPLIFIAASLFSLVTVYVSSLRACQIVGKVSPIEALRLSENEKTRKEVKANTSVSWIAMSLQNILRDWKGSAVVMLSIALCLIALNCIVMLTQGYDFDQYKKVFLSSDFQLGQMASTATTTNFNGITPKTRDILEANPDSEKNGYVYYSKESHEMELSLRQAWERHAKQFEKYWSDYEKGIWREADEGNKVSVHFLGINEPIFEKLEWREKPCSWKEFSSGDFVIVDYPKYSKYENDRYYEMGDSFLMKYTNGNKKEYQVLGEAIMPYSLDYPYADKIFITIFVPESEYIKCTGNDNAMYAAVDAKEGREQAVQTYIDGEILSQNSIMNVSSIIEMEKSFQRYLDKFYFIGGFIAAVLGIIGVMNFFNTSAASVLNRSKELALLEVVGMGKKQIKKMLVAEGIFYVGGAFIIAIAFLCLGAEKLISNTIGMAFFFRLELTLWPCILMIPILIVIAFIIPIYNFNRVSSESVVDRIRQV